MSVKHAMFAALLAAGLAQPAMAAARSDGGAALIIAAESPSMIWNGVAVDHGRIFVAGPRWTGSKGPAIGIIGKDGRPLPYPDPGWNAWRAGDDPVRAFVNINAIHLDGKGALWAVDTGSPDFGGNPLPGGAKLVAIDLATDRVKRVIPFGPDIALPGSYVDDIRFNGNFAYLTDAGRPGIIIVNLATGAMRRVLDDDRSTGARADRPIILDGKTLLAPDGNPLRVNSDPLEISPDGKWLYFAPLPGPWSRIETRWLDDFSTTPERIAAKVEPWADLPPVGGTAMDANGDLYFADLAANALKRRTPDGRITTLIQDERLHWVDAPFVDSDHVIWLPVPQMDRVALFNGGMSKTKWPVRLYRLALKPAR
ncbi:hypothetical protein CLG96_04950 [Sphingomonas oleivorans]|uniref:Gluconolactonase n=1 Tax=Sphingomonas oleivorans TaxID=1735121 RepID=A0A2T5G2T4_9SPHN|nr:L-dopachrome tautomerase-related protein [Sphingomonas oleivorans]PTQ13440.1 hypothetical protein CLG96_04950 [Sphingomonas oleivorans]